MNCHVIKEEWAKSLSIFSRRELLIFVFSWLKTFQRSFLTFITYFGWLLILDLVIKTKIVSIDISTMVTAQNLPYFFMLAGAAMTATVFSIFFMLLSIRASVDTKDFSYFASNMKKLSGFLALYAILFIPIIFFSIRGASTTPDALSILAGLKFSRILIQSLFIVVFPVSVLFFLDHHNNLSYIGTSLKNALKSILYNFPPFLALLFFYYFTYYSVSLVFSFTHYSLLSAVTFVVNFLFICATAVLYLKIKHSNYKLFFQ